MRKLEKILEEIEAEFDRRIDIQLKIMAGLGDDVYRYGYGKSLEAYQQGKLFVEDIIHNHINDGWIPVEDRMPEVLGKYWATIRYDDGRISEPVVVDFRGVREKYVVDTPNGREYETWGIDSAFHGSRVIAWRPYYIPEPYRPERSE